jgi:hypothetical protein
MGKVSIPSIIYLIIGAIVASDRGYLNNLGTVAHLVSALVAILVWPLVLLGVNLHLVF